MRKLLWGSAAALVLGSTAAGIYLFPEPAAQTVPFAGGSSRQVGELQTFARPMPSGDTEELCVEPIIVERAEGSDAVDDPLVTFTPGTDSLNASSDRVSKIIPRSVPQGYKTYELPSNDLALENSIEQGMCAEALLTQVQEEPQRGIRVGFGVKITTSEKAPRPDAETAQQRMPYADEDASPVSFVFWIDHLPAGQDEHCCKGMTELCAALQQLSGLFTVAQPANEAEESEVPVPASGPEPPVSEPAPVPLPHHGMDYHHHYPSCPYTGRCPAPYPLPPYTPPVKPRPAQ
jgi:hypothetical protein